MCGFLLIWSKGNLPDKAILQRVAQNGQWRGPDASGEYYGDFGKGSFYLATHRLRIADQDTQADQPIASANGEYLLAYNGEIYNYKELAAKYLPAVSPATSEGEILLSLLQHQGPSILAECRGMFALCFLHLPTGTGFLARDAFGIKPLYYAQFGEMHCFSSTVESLLQINPQRPKLSQKGIQDYLRFYYVQPPFTLWEGIRSFNLGQVLSIPSMETQNIPLPKVAVHLDPDSQSKRIETLLAEALQLQWKSAYNPALLLSGGVDSALLLAASAHLLGETPDLWHVSVPTIEEEKNALKLAQHFGAKLNVLPIEECCQPGQFEPFLRAIDHPVGDSAFFLTYAVANAVKGATRVLWSGAGADELCAGYRRHGMMHFIHQHSRLSKSISYLQHIAATPKHKILLKAMAYHPEECYVPLSARCLMPYLNTEKVIDPRYYDLKTYLPGDVLSLTDMAGMMAGVEIRVPYLDQNLSALLLHWSWLEHRKKGQKWMLRNLLKQYGVHQLITKRKLGFGAPEHALLEKALGMPLVEYFKPHTALKMEIEFVAGIQGKTYAVRHVGQHAWAWVFLLNYLKGRI